MFFGIDARLVYSSRRTPYFLSDVGGLIMFNPLLCRGMPGRVVLSGTGRSFMLCCTPPPGNYEVMFVQGSGGQTVTTFDARIKPFGGSWPSLSAGAGKIDLLALASDGTNVVGTISLNA